VPPLADQLCANKNKSQPAAELGAENRDFPLSFPELACAQLQTIFQHAFPNGGTNGQPLAESFVACSRNGHPRKSAEVLKTKQRKII